MLKKLMKCRLQNRERKRATMADVESIMCLVCWVTVATVNGVGVIRPLSPTGQCLVNKQVPTGHQQGCPLKWDTVKHSRIMQERLTNFCMVLNTSLSIVAEAVHSAELGKVSRCKSDKLEN